MECGFIISTEDFESYTEQLEALLPLQIDGITCEGGLMVRYAYIPNSLTWLGYEDSQDHDPLTPYWIDCTYQVTQSEIRSDIRQHGLEDSLKDLYLSRPVILDGYVPIAIDCNGEMILDDLDFILGLETATEGYL